jgi:hypothetical protein
MHVFFYDVELQGTSMRDERHFHYKEVRIDGCAIGCGAKQEYYVSEGVFVISTNSKIQEIQSYIGILALLTCQRLMIIFKAISTSVI